MDINIDIQKYILSKYTPIKAPVQTLELIYDPDKTQHRLKSLPALPYPLLRCAFIKFPFECTDLIDMPIKNALLLSDVENDKKRVWELTLDTAKKILHAESDKLDYQPGDTIGILPINASDNVKQLLCAMQLEDVADNFYELRLLPNCTKKSEKIPEHIPPYATPREILYYCLNLNAILKKQLLRGLAECCTQAEEHDFFACLSSREATRFYNEIIIEKGLNLLQLLNLCPSCKPTLPLLIEQLPRLLPRPYSIANSPLAHKNELRIIFSVLKENAGVTTNMLEVLANASIAETVPQMPRTKILMYLRKPNKFRYTAEQATSNQILISIGTGLAPFLGFLEHKEHMLKTQKLTAGQLGETWLFIGATNEQSILHRANLLEWKAAGILNKYFESFSRVPDAQHRYIQEQLEANSQALVEFLLQPQTILYVCADGAKISNSLETAISKCLQQELNINEAETKAMLKEFRANGKYREDLWI